MIDRYEWRHYTSSQWRQLAHHQADKIERLEAELFTMRNVFHQQEEELHDAHYHGYMAGAGDSEDYDHDPVVMEKYAWQEYLGEDSDE